MRRGGNMYMASHAYLKINTETFKEFSVLSKKNGIGTLRGFLLGICFFLIKATDNRVAVCVQLIAQNQLLFLFTSCRETPV